MSEAKVTDEKALIEEYLTEVYSWNPPDGKRIFWENYEELATITDDAKQSRHANLLAVNIANCAKCRWLRDIHPAETYEEYIAMSVLVSSHVEHCPKLTLLEKLHSLLQKNNITHAVLSRSDAK